MNFFSQNASARNAASGAAPQDVSNSVDATLRLIASLPAPEGLEDRVLAGLRAAPRTSRLLHWPVSLQPSSGWRRAAAAAAIVAVIVGGGWGLSRVQQPQPIAKGFVAPQRPAAAAAGGFSNAGAMRTPQTLNGPVVAQPEAAQPVPAKPAKKVPARTVTRKLSPPQAAATDKAAAPPAAPSQVASPVAEPAAK